MAKIIGIYPKDIYSTIELSSKQVKYILDFLGKCRLEYDGTLNPEMKTAVDYVTNDFFSKLTEIEKAIGEFRNEP